MIIKKKRDTDRGAVIYKCMYIVTEAIFLYKMLYNFIITYDEGMYRLNGGNVWNLHNFLYPFLKRYI